MTDGFDQLFSLLNLSEIMSNTLEKKSNIAFLKSKFFVVRAFSYFSFLLAPVWAQRSTELNTGFHSLIMIVYILFMAGQWFLLGKEIDHRLKIFYRVNSSIDRIIYRLIVGKVFFMIIFSLFSVIPYHIVNHFFWGLWVVLGLFYSWPTRGKIIQETVTSELGEFKFLDRFEKTVLALTSIIFLVSMPEMPNIENFETLKVYFDTNDVIATQYWDFIKINYFPFWKYPQLLKLAVCMHFYFVGLGIYLICFYGLLRFFVSRRLSLLGVFAIVSSWSFPKYLAQNFALSTTATFSVLWVWSQLWVAKSATYRTGLLIGLIGLFGTLLNPRYFFLIPLQVIILVYFFMKDKNLWFKKQTIKYIIFGTSLALFIMLANIQTFQESMTPLNLKIFSAHIKDIFEKKAFYIISLFGVAGVISMYTFEKANFLSDLKISKEGLKHLLVSLVGLTVFSLIFDQKVMTSFGLIWPITLFSLLPLECIFQVISRFRSKRNLIYVAYILICLLDSHFEGRVKVFLKLFQ